VTDHKREAGLFTLTLVLAEAELEPIPEAIRDHPAVRARARSRGRRAGRTLLDSSYHHSAMRGLEGAERRGRPDIVHQALLLAQDAPLNRLGLLRTFVHTRGDLVVLVDPTMRPPRNYDRFVGLVEQLLREGEVGAGEGIGGRPLMRLERSTLGGLLEGLGTWNVALWEGGEAVDPVAFLSSRLGTDVALVVGAFPHGDFLGGTDWADARVSLGPEPLTAPTVVARMVHAFEMAIGGTHPPSP
jgi:rRNA small subunit pseudouridine methyltransferase Nep1